MEKKQVKCPVCGKFTTEAKRASYESMSKEVESLRQSLEYRDMEKHADEELLEKKRKTIEELTARERLLRERYSQLKQQLEAMADENVDLRMENARLVNRGFLDRVFNR